jgi:Cu-Zn family superoxide dismutase
LQKNAHQPYDKFRPTCRSLSPEIKMMMAKPLFVIFTVACCVISPSASAAARSASAVLINASGTTVGTASLQQAPEGVLIRIEVWNLPPGAHGIHLHSVGKCTPDFKAAGGHINPHKRAHGLLNPDGPDRGDLPNLFVSAGGTGKAEFFTTRVSLTTGTAPLLDEDGSAFIIHEHADDHMTQPIGGAAGRIACGVINTM